MIFSTSWESPPLCHIRRRSPRTAQTQILYCFVKRKPPAHAFQKRESPVLSNKTAFSHDWLHRAHVLFVPTYALAHWLEMMCASRRRQGWHCSANQTVCGLRPHCGGSVCMEFKFGGDFWSSWQNFGDGKLSNIVLLNHHINLSWISETHGGTESFIAMKSILWGRRDFPVLQIVIIILWWLLLSSPLLEWIHWPVNSVSPRGIIYHTSPV